MTSQPDVVHDIRTEFGEVRVYQHGPAGGPPGGVDPRVLPDLGHVVGANPRSDKWFHGLYARYVGPAGSQHTNESDDQTRTMRTQHRRGIAAPRSTGRTSGGSFLRRLACHPHRRVGAEPTQHTDAPRSRAHGGSPLPSVLAQPRAAPYPPAFRTSRTRSGMGDGPSTARQFHRHADSAISGGIRCLWPTATDGSLTLPA